MPRLPLLADEDLFDLVAFLRSDDPSVRPSQAGPARERLSVLGKLLMRFAWRPLRNPERPIVAPDPTKYGCRSCHGDADVEIGDLRKASQHYPDDAALEAWIRLPTDFKPQTKMPTFDKAIRPEDFPPLLAYVRELSKRADSVQKK
ncbi:MAG: hypothetical protein JO116_12100 [Planctomycetaceae bacterium]|nr:hypothetical protein [Planctomycetaceae bacterium]